MIRRLRLRYNDVPSERLRALNLTLNHARDAAHTRADIHRLTSFIIAEEFERETSKSEKAAPERPVSPRLASRIAPLKIRFIRC